MTKNVGARVGLSAILVLWGVASGAMAFIDGARGFYILRLAIGATEAGFFPSVIYYLTLFVDESDMGLNYTIVVLATALSGIIGGPLAGLILTYAHGVAGLSGWRWLFLAEALPTVALGLFTLYYLDSEPASAAFLTPPERAFIVARQRRQRTTREAAADAADGMGAALRLTWLWLLIAVWFLYSCGYYGIIFWMPLLLKSLGDRSNITIGFISAVPYAFAGMAMIGVAHSSDTSRERRLHMSISAFISAAGFFGAAAVHTVAGNAMVPLVVCLCVSTAGIYAMFGPFWGIPTSVLSGETAAAGFALINSVGVIGGFIGPWIVGELTQGGGGYDSALVLFGVMMIASGFIGLCLDPKLGSGSGVEDDESTTEKLMPQSEGVRSASDV